MSLGYISVVPQVVQVPTDIPVPQPNVSSGIIGNGMYAAHDEPVRLFHCVPCKMVLFMLSHWHLLQREVSDTVSCPAADLYCP